MGQQSNNQQGQTTIRLPLDVLEFLEGLVQHRIYGTSKGGIIRRLVMEGVEGIVKDGLIGKTLADREMLAQLKRGNIREISKKSGGV